MACRVHHAVSPAAQCEDAEGEHEYVVNKALVIVQMNGYAEGVGELVRLVRLELEAPGRSRSVAEPVNVYKKHNEGAYDG